jgi:hypothetical protein
MRTKYPRSATVLARPVGLVLSATGRNAFTGPHVHGAMIVHQLTLGNEKHAQYHQIRRCRRIVPHHRMKSPGSSK